MRKFGSSVSSSLLSLRISRSTVAMGLEYSSGARSYDMIGAREHSTSLVRNSAVEILIPPTGLATSSCSFSVKRFYSSTNNNVGDDDEFDDDVFSFDASASVEKDRKKQQQSEIIDQIVNAILPQDKNGPEEVNKVRDYLKKYPINNAIVATQVKITHTVDDEGKPLKMNLPIMKFEEALTMAEENGLDLVQLSLNNDLAFCRMRDEKPNILQLIDGASGGKTTVGGGNTKGAGGQQQQQSDKSGGGAGQQQQQGTFTSEAPLFKMKGGFKQSPDIGEVVLTDVSDSHFMNWKGQKVIDAMKKGHPIKLLMRDFQSVDTAIETMKKFTEVIKDKAMSPVMVPFHIPQVKAGGDSLSVTVTPVNPAKQNFIKILADKDWRHHAGKMSGEMGTERKGTYVRNIEKAKRTVTTFGKGKDGQTRVLDSSAQKKLQDDDWARSQFRQAREFDPYTQ